MSTRSSACRTHLRKGHLAGRDWIHVRSPEPRALLFAPPLIGGGALQQVKDFRGLVRSGFDFFSFSYSGHGPGSGRFSLRAAVQDTVDLLSFAMNAHRPHGMPAAGVAACFGAIPMLKALEQTGEPLSRLVLVNALPRWIAFEALGSFWHHHRSRVRNGRWRPAHLEASLADFLDRFFPRVLKSAGRFGRLARSRVHMRDTLADLLWYRPMRGLRLEKTPVLCVYARQDRLLKSFWTLEPGGSYESALRRLCPLARFLTIDSDHYLLSGRARSRALRSVAAFLSCGEDRAGTPSLQSGATAAARRRLWRPLHVDV